MNEKDKKIVIDTLSEWKEKYEGCLVTFYNKEDGYFLNNFAIDSEGLKIYPNGISAHEFTNCYFYVNLNHNYDIWEYSEPDEDDVPERYMHCLRLTKDTGMEVTFNFRQESWKHGQTN